MEEAGANRMIVRAIVLAAGKGTRMKSATPKVLHEICGRPLLWYVLQSLRDAGIDDILVVTNDELEARIGEFGARGIVQREQLGTGHAVQVGLGGFPARDGRIIVASGDMPLVPSDVFRAMIGSLGSDAKASAAMALVTARMPLTSNFGRVVRRDGNIERIVEVRDASPSELAIDEMNAGVYAFDEAALRDAVTHLTNDNAQKEYYLTDTVGHFVGGGKVVRPVLADDHLHVLGINDRVELALARREMNARICAQHMRDGVTIVDPATTYLEPELTIGRDTVVYQNTAISRLSEIGANCVIGPNTRLSSAKVGERVEVRESVITDSEVGSGSGVGPFAHIRGGAQLDGAIASGISSKSRIRNTLRVRSRRTCRISATRRSVRIRISVPVRLRVTTTAKRSTARISVATLRSVRTPRLSRRARSVMAR